MAMGHAIPGMDINSIVPGQVGKWIEFALTTPVVLWAGGFFFTRAWQSIVNRSLNMFTLIAVGVGRGIFYSVHCSNRAWNFSLFFQTSRRSRIFTLKQLR